MVMDFEKLLNLQRFADGATGGGGEGGAGAEGVDAAPAELPAPNHRRRRENPLANVRYGVDAQTEAPAGEGHAAAPQEESFDDLINGRYKADFDKRVQGIVQNRLRASKASEEQLGKLQPIADMLAERYGTDDPGALLQALSDDKALYEAEAVEKGVPVELLIKTKQLERQQKMLDRQQQEIAQRNQAEQEYANLLQQAAALKAVNPAFDLDAEMANPAFGRMVLKPPMGSGIPLESAYYAIHHREIEAAQRQQHMQVTQYAVAQTQQKVANAIAAGQHRPSENGATGASPAINKADPRNLTRADRDEIRKRVRNGERIVF